MNSPSKCRQKATRKRVGRVETQWGAKRTTKVPIGGRDPQAWRRERNRLSHKEAYKGYMNPQSIWLWKPRDKFLEFLLVAGLTAWSFKNQWASFWESLEGQRKRESLTLKRQQNKQPMDIQHRNSSLKNTWGILGGDLLLSECALDGQRFWEIPPKIKEQKGNVFFPLP